MKLTVALRIIGGFGIISLLLLVIGATSYVSLNNISTSTAEVNEVSIPALENSAQMQSEFVIMSKLSLQAFNATSLEDVGSMRQQFNTEQQRYQQASAQLATAVQHNAPLKTAAQTVAQGNREWQGHGQADQYAQARHRCGSQKPDAETARHVFDAAAHGRRIGIGHPVDQGFDIVLAAAVPVAVEVLHEGARDVLHQRRQLALLGGGELEGVEAENVHACLAQADPKRVGIEGRKLAETPEQEDVVLEIAVLGGRDKCSGYPLGCLVRV